MEKLPRRSAAVFLLGTALVAGGFALKSGFDAEQLYKMTVEGSISDPHGDIAKRAGEDHAKAEALGIITLPAAALGICLLMGDYLRRKEESENYKGDTA